MMLEKLAINIIPFTIFFHIGISNCYENKKLHISTDISCYRKARGDETKNPKPLPIVTISGKYKAARVRGDVTPSEAKTLLVADWCKSSLSSPSEPWIALIPPYGFFTNSSSKCGISKQIETIRKHNASALIIVESKDIHNIDDKTIKDLIYVTITDSDSQILLEKYKEKHVKQLVCNILNSKNVVEKQWKVSKTSVLFVLVSFILLMCISLAWLVFYYVQRFRHIYRNDRKEKQLLSAAKKAISKLKTISFQAGSKDGEDDSCAVCLENYKEGENIRVLPCKHEFHKSCIDPWLLNHRTCPMCKSNILKSLGVEIPDNIDLSQHDVESRRASRENVTIHLSPPPTAAAPVEETSVTEQIPEPSSSVYAPGGSTSQAWADPTVVSASCYSSTSSMLSDTDSERSTVALVAMVQKV